MKLEDPTETWDFFTKTAGEAYVTKVDSFQTKDTSIANSYMDTKSSSFEKRSRIDLLDLKDQTEGEAHIFFKSKIVRARMFYANPTPVKHLKLNQFLKVEPPPDEYLIKLQKQLVGFQSVLDSGDLSIEKEVESEEITMITQALHDSAITEPIERSVAALLAYHTQNEPEPLEELVEVEEEGALTVFSKLRRAPGVPLLVKDAERFSQPLLPINETRDYLSTIERATGVKDKYAGTVATELVKDFQMATSYPPPEREVMDAGELTALVQELTQKVVTEREKAKAKAQEEK